LTPSGIPYALLAYGSWGLVPLFWKSLKHIPAGEILIHRVLWSTVLLMGLLWFRNGMGVLKEGLRVRANLRSACVSSVLIGINWIVYIQAVNSGHVLETSLGYFINPLVNVALGVFFLKEKPHAHQWWAMGLASLGVANMMFGVGTFPLIALTLSLTFGFYGLVRKRAQLPSLQGSALESALLGPFALLALGYLLAQGKAETFAHGPATVGLLVFGGAVTALPLLWFSEAAKRLTLTTLGFFQFLAPTLQFLLAVFVFNEKFTFAHSLSFGFIWAGLAVNVAFGFWNRETSS
jgi:chloramphenicol-sensitive protein RarD